MPILLDNIDEAAKFSTAVEATKARTIHPLWSVVALCTEDSQGS